VDGTSPSTGCTCIMSSPLSDWIDKEHPIPLQILRLNHVSSYSSTRHTNLFLYRSTRTTIGIRTVFTIRLVALERPHILYCLLVLNDHGHFTHSFISSVFSRWHDCLAVIVCARALLVQHPHTPSTSVCFIL